MEPNDVPCPTCGKRLEFSAEDAASARFCWHCGAAVDGVAAGVAPPKADPPAWNATIDSLDAARERERNAAAPERWLAAGRALGWYLRLVAVLEGTFGGALGLVAAVNGEAVGGLILISALVTCWPVYKLGDWFEYGARTMVRRAAPPGDQQREGASE